MFKLFGFLAVLMATAALVGISASVASAQEGPARFTGTVTIDGKPAFDGATVIATVNGINCGSGFATGGSYTVDVTSDLEGKEGCGKPGDTVVFVLGGEGDPGGQEFDQKGVWDDTKANELNLTLSHGDERVTSDGRTTSFTWRKWLSVVRSYYRRWHADHDRRRSRRHQESAKCFGISPQHSELRSG